jgi:hypothetical protein
MVFDALKNRIMTCYINAEWEVLEETEDKICFKHSHLGKNLFEKKTMSQKVNFEKITNHVFVKYSNDEYTVFYIYFIYKNEVYGFETSFRDEKLSNKLYLVDESGMHHSDRVGYELRESLASDIEEMKKLNRELLEKIPEFRLLLLTGTHH